MDSPQPRSLRLFPRWHMPWSNRSNDSQSTSAPSSPSPPPSPLSIFGLNSSTPNPPSLIHYDFSSSSTLSLVGSSSSFPNISAPPCLSVNQRRHQNKPTPSLASMPKDVIHCIVRALVLKDPKLASPSSAFFGTSSSSSSRKHPSWRALALTCTTLYTHTTSFFRDAHLCAGYRRISCKQCCDGSELELVLKRFQFNQTNILEITRTCSSLTAYSLRAARAFRGGQYAASLLEVRFESGAFVDVSAIKMLVCFPSLRRLVLSENMNTALNESLHEVPPHISVVVFNGLSVKCLSSVRAFLNDPSPSTPNTASDQELAAFFGLRGHARDPELDYPQRVLESVELNFVDGSEHNPHLDDNAVFHTTRYDLYAPESTSYSDSELAAFVNYFTLRITTLGKGCQYLTVSRPHLSDSHLAQETICSLCTDFEPNPQFEHAGKTPDIILSIVHPWFSKPLDNILALSEPYFDALVTAGLYHEGVTFYAPRSGKRQLLHSNISNITRDKNWCEDGIKQSLQGLLIDVDASISNDVQHPFYPSSIENRRLFGAMRSLTEIHLRSLLDSAYVDEEANIQQMNLYLSYFKMLPKPTRVLQLTTKILYSLFDMDLLDDFFPLFAHVRVVHMHGISSENSTSLGRSPKDGPRVMALLPEVFRAIFEHCTFIQTLSCHFQISSEEADGIIIDEQVLHLKKCNFGLIQRLSKFDLSFRRHGLFAPGVWSPCGVR